MRYHFYKPFSNASLWVQIYRQSRVVEWPIRIIDHWFPTHQHVYFYMREKHFEFKTKNMFVQLTSKSNFLANSSFSHFEKHDSSLKIEAVKLFRCLWLCGHVNKNFVQKMKLFCPVKAKILFFFKY